jgi:hypothetical protein
MWDKNRPVDRLCFLGGILIDSEKINPKSKIANLRKSKEIKERYDQIKPILKSKLFQKISRKYSKCRSSGLLLSVDP